ncbi:MAG: transketolase [Myxococcales bacterium]|nr:transketolase [Myxococcales bacterium]
MPHKLDQLAINTIRFLAVDAVQAANSGHPGAPLGAAPMAYVLWDRVLRHHPRQPRWFNRDRFVLSAGHASAMLYALLHLTGYDLSLDDIKNFRQWGSKTPGHPEYGEVPGVEVTTGPLGQGFAHGVGMALAEKWLAARYNRPGHAIIDHFTYAIVSDGDLQEGISYEAASLAGHLRLGKLIYLYDDNGIQIEGSTGTNFTEDIHRRFAAQEWQVIGPVDGNDVAALEKAIALARQETEKPSLIHVKTVIGFGSPFAGQADCHGSPLGPEKVAKTKETLGWPLSPAFHVPAEVAEYLGRAVERGAGYEAEWQQKFAAYAAAYPELAEKLRGQMENALPAGWDEGLAELFAGETKPVATRAASGKVLNQLAKKIDWLLGGSADLAPSNQTWIKGEPELSPENPGGRNIHFGVREHAMGAIAGGLALHGGIIPYTGTFLTFSDYMRTPMRLAALMGIRAIYLFSHDSIGLGEDGPTHQPIEHAMLLRQIPNLVLIRPADAAETVEAWKAALTRDNGPTTLLLTRQNVPIFDRAKYGAAAGLHRGGYVLWDSTGKTPQIIFIGTGSELSLALAAGEKLAAEGLAVRVVSLPSWELFDRQDAAYRETVLPAAVRARVAVEAGSTQGWQKYVGLDGAVIGLDRFGLSAPFGVLYEKFGFTVENLVATAKKCLK